jgi:hypothetical protein
MWLIIFVIILFILYLIYNNHLEESFFPFFSDTYGTTRNMSYDIRGDPYIPFVPVSPWNNPEVLPIRNREMIMY